ncbi:phage GP46 family protein [Neptuniibacter marinus]|jgi:phage gp46-like protein|uniref:phage GP46 family protein n=1 Tax=Neptuniibacter marinus TaxID=1806670 RepID=UPI003B5A6BDC
MNLLTLSYNNDSKRIDLQSKRSSFLTWLENAVVISLFTDARCELDELPQGETDQRGYWGDIDLPESESLGSKLWTLKREKVIPKTINRARDYATEALQWLLEDDYLQSIKVESSRGDTYRIDLLIQCKLKDGSWVKLYHDYLIGASN